MQEKSGMWKSLSSRQASGMNMKRSDGPSRQQSLPASSFLRLPLTMGTWLGLRSQVACTDLARSSVCSRPTPRRAASHTSTQQQSRMRRQPVLPSSARTLPSPGLRKHCPVRRTLPRSEPHSRAKFWTSPGTRTAGRGYVVGSICRAWRAWRQFSLGCLEKVWTMDTPVWFLGNSCPLIMRISKKEMCNVDVYAIQSLRL